ncbi:hypothetical protein CAOG_010042 [Capsaspora owczarzaki ATCC 30864]|uniref:Endonuclease GajA/Old nuclease/RecF-like AAA domain-containing protein n=1 Tax=Capsaspora owczarzaki (strain ATCC 30864) TaxID=595528 RepID=A0A0D2WW81_CAPO3|nr:hypothetical protein CAOG_010042 [Capsaspora owczarzaki ATCC 30864]
MDSATQVETQSEFRLHQLRLQNFKKFEDITLTLTPSPKIIVGANGSGKTQILWAILIFLRGHNARVPSSKHFDSDPFKFSGELQDLFGDRLFVNQYKAPDTLVRVGARNKKFTLTGTFLDPTYHHTNENVVLQYSLRDGLLHDKPENHESLAPIRFAFMPPTYQWGDLSEELHRNEPFLTAGVQYLRWRLFQAKDFVNDGLHHLGFQATVAAPNKDGPAIATVTERGATLDIGACAGSLQKIIAILTLLYHLTAGATINAAQDDARGKKIAHDSTRCAHLPHRRARSTALRECDGQATDQQIMFLTPDGKAVELTGELPKDEQGRASLYPILDALSQVKSSKPLLVLEGTNDQAFYSKYTTLGQHFHFLTTSGAVNKQNLSNILTQAKLKHVFLRDSDMYAASPDLPTAQARITQVVGAPVIYTLLPCIESYLILHRLLRSTDIDTRRFRMIQALQQRKWLATMTNDDLSTFSKGDLKRICDICKQPIVNEKGNRKDQASAAADPATPDASDAFGSLFAPGNNEDQASAAKGSLFEASTSTNNTSPASASSNPTTEAADSDLSSGSGSDAPAQDLASDLASSENDETMAMVDRVLADSENDPDVLWNSLLAQLTAEATSSFDRNNRVSFWTTYVSIVRGHDLMPNAAAVMRGLERQHLHPAVKTLLADTEQAVLACLR